MIGGRNSTIEEFPYAVLFELSGGPEKGPFYICTGSILSPYFVITAAHCVEDKNLSKMQIRAGTSYRFGKDGVVHKVRNFTICPERLKIKLNLFDVAILQLVEPIVLDNITRKSIQMFGPGEEIKGGTTATVMGWGCFDVNENHDIDQLQSINIAILANEKCPYTGYKQICSSGVNTEKNVPGICSGDSGGPLVIRGKLAGVVKSTAKDSVYSPNIFSEVSKHRYWIDKIVKL